MRIGQEILLLIISPDILHVVSGLLGTFDSRTQIIFSGS